MSPRGESGMRALTVIELLVVLAVIALLIGLLVPALASVRDAGRSAQCQTNLRQMALAARMYSIEYRIFPVALRYEVVDGVGYRVEWDWVTTMVGHELVSPGPLWEFTDNPRHVMQCPAFHGNANAPGNPYTGYNYNTTYIGGEATAVQPGWDVIRPGIRPSQCYRPAQCAMFGCAGFKGGANKFMRAPLNSEGLALSTIYSGGQAFRHRGACNVVHVDGSVRTYHQPAAGELATDELLESYMGYPENGFLSNDDDAYRPK